MNVKHVSLEVASVHTEEVLWDVFRTWEPIAVERDEVALAVIIDPYLFRAIQELDEATWTSLQDARQRLWELDEDGIMMFAVEEVHQLRQELVEKERAEQERRHRDAK